MAESASVMVVGGPGVGGGDGLLKCFQIFNGAVLYVTGHLYLNMFVFNLQRLIAGVRAMEGDQAHLHFSISV